MQRQKGFRRGDEFGIILSTLILSVSHQVEEIKVCNKTRTEKDKKQCLEDLLNARKASINFYLNNISFGEKYVTRCEDFLSSSKDENWQIYLQTYGKGICSEAARINKLYLNEIKTSDIDYNSKYIILVTLYCQEKIFNENIKMEEMNILLRNLEKSKYKSLFSEK